jgi:hypothetical protein
MRRRAGEGTTTRNDTPRSRKVGDITTTAEEEELGTQRRGTWANPPILVPQIILLVIHDIYYNTLVFPRKTEPNEPSRKRSPVWKYLPQLGTHHPTTSLTIHPFLNPQTCKN